MFILSALFLFARCLIVPRMKLAAEILALRQQLALLHRTAARPQLRQRDRLFWVVVSKLWNDWPEVLVIVTPETVITWHRQGFLSFTGGGNPQRVPSDAHQ